VHRGPRPETLGHGAGRGPKGKIARGDYPDQGRRARETRGGATADRGERRAQAARGGTVATGWPKQRSPAFRLDPIDYRRRFAMIRLTVGRPAENHCHYRNWAWGVSNREGLRTLNHMGARQQCGLLMGPAIPGSEFKGKGRASRSEQAAPAGYHQQLAERLLCGTPIQNIRVGTEGLHRPGGGDSLLERHRQAQARCRSGLGLQQ